MVVIRHVITNSVVLFAVNDHTIGTENIVLIKGMFVKYLKIL